MAFTNYGTFKTALASWLARSDLEQQIPDFIGLATTTLNRLMRDTRMVTSTTISVGTNKSAAVPTDMLEPLYVADNANEDNYLQQLPPDLLGKLRLTRMPASGTPRYFSIIGRNIEVCPTPSSSFTAVMNYYQAIAALASDSDTNWVLTYHPDIYLYTALYHAVPFLRDDQRSALFENAVFSQVKAVIEKNEKATFDGMTRPGFGLNETAFEGAT